MHVIKTNQLHSCRFLADNKEARWYEGRQQVNSPLMPDGSRTDPISVCRLLAGSQQSAFEAKSQPIN